jgi:threonyl-tRNA synthetase
LSTVQVDFHQPERFGLAYVGPDGAKHRPVMVHRSIVGSVERAVAQLIEEHGGAFPAWLAPVQLVVHPVSAAEADGAAAVVERARELGLRAEFSDASQGSLGARVRAARLVPYQVVWGAAEAAADLLALRLRGGSRPAAVPVAEGLRRIAGQVAAHSADLWPGEAAEADRAVRG